ncbi:MAG: TonB-dependent receptor, partial [Ignavibacteriaceae bacterium]
LIKGTNTGSATDAEGYYSILNVRAGSYVLQFRYLGFQTKEVENVTVNSDQTTQIDIQLSEEVIQGEVVTVTAKKPLVEFNQTSSVSTVSRNEIENLPVQSLTEVVNLQAGVVDGHFRGGRIGEVQYQVDGVTVNNPYDNSSTLSLDKSVLEEVQVISGTFDAKYGQANSGVVNAVLRSGNDKFQFSGETYAGDYYTTDTDKYPNVNKVRPSTIQNYQLTLSGPTLLPSTNFFISGRRYINEGWLYGERRFIPTDSSNFETHEINPTGDNKVIPMDTHREWSGQIKLSNQSISAVQLNYQAIINYFKETRYSNGFRFNPDGISDQTTVSISHGIDFTQTISDKMYYKLSARNNYFDYKDYKYENLYDPRYIEAGQPKGDNNYEDGAIIQGVDLGRFVQKTNSGIFKGDFTWQFDRFNFIESGLSAQIYKLRFGSPGYIRATTVDGTQILLAQESIPDEPGIQSYSPYQFSGYLQDRVEVGDLVVRAGVRLEYFDANATVPSDLKNPANTIAGAPESFAKKTTKKIAVAPRLGFSFPLTERASIYFSYGHFYQMPGLGLLYSNANYSLLRNVQEGGITYGVFGNPDLKPEFTVQYEFGLKQAFGQNLGTELTFFYKDIRDLLGVEFITTYNVSQYPRYTNIDFGSAYGFTLSLDQRAIGLVSTTIDYTLQFAQGNSSDPQETANRAQAGKDSRPRDVPFNWDQRHTLNATALYFVPNNFSISAIVRFGTGQPYTPQKGPSSFTSDLETNSGVKSSFVLVDIRAEKFFTLDFLNISLFARVFNLFNQDFVNGFVFAGTGSPDFSLTPVIDRVQLNNPARYYQPRRIEVGISLRSL